MTDAMRFNYSANPNELGLCEDPDGNYVHYEDYQRLREQNAELVEVLEWLRDNAYRTTKEIIAGLADKALKHRAESAEGEKL